MQYKSTGISYQYIIPAFCDQLCNVDNTSKDTVTNPNSALKKHLVSLLRKKGKLDNTDETGIGLALELCVSDYYRELDKSLPKKTRVVSGRPGSNVKNLFDTEDPTMPSRLTLLEIAFTLGLNASETNKLFEITGQYPLHLGGDPQESILFYCLDKGLTHLDAINMYQRHCKNIPLSDSLEKNKKTLSQRSQFIADELRKAILIEDAQRSLRDFEKKLGIYAASYSYYSGRVRKYMLNLFDHKAKDKYTSRPASKETSLKTDFDGLFKYTQHKKEVDIQKHNNKKQDHETKLYEHDDGDEICDREKNYSRGTKSDIGKIESGESQPTREAVFMLLCVDYYRNYEQLCPIYSLEEYVNHWLQHFDLEELNDTRIFEALILELSNYQLNKQKSKSPIYKAKQHIIFNDCYGSYVEQAGCILDRYIQELKEKNIVVPIGTVKLIKKNNYIQDLFLKTPGDKKR